MITHKNIIYFLGAVALLLSSGSAVANANVDVKTMVKSKITNQTDRPIKVIYGYGGPLPVVCDKKIKAGQSYQCDNDKNYIELKHIGREATRHLLFVVNDVKTGRKICILNVKLFMKTGNSSGIGGDWYAECSAKPVESVNYTCSLKGNKIGFGKSNERKALNCDLVVKKMDDKKAK